MSEAATGPALAVRSLGPSPSASPRLQRYPLGGVPGRLAVARACTVHNSIVTAPAVIIDSATE